MIRLAASLPALVASLLAAEAVVRLVAPQPRTWLSIYTRHASFPTYTHRPHVDESLDTGEVAWTVLTDSDGFRCGRGAPTGDPRPPLLLLGDSYTFGPGVDHEQTFCGRIESAFAGRIRVVNAGVNGYGPREYRQVLEHLLRAGMQPALVIVTTYLGNDFQDCVWSKDVPVVDGILGADVRSLRGLAKRNSHLYRLAAKVYHQAASAPRDDLGAEQRQMYVPGRWEDAPLRAAAQTYRSEFLAMGGLCKERSIPLLVCIIPAEHSVADLENRTAHAEGLDTGLPERVSAAAFRDAGLPFWSAGADLAVLGSKRAYFAFDNHLMPEGHRVVAEGILGQESMRSFLEGLEGR